MFVVDSFDRERLGEAKTELWQILKDQRLRKEAVLIVFANKQDLSNSLTPDEVQKQLELTSVTDRPWCECSECKHTRTHTCSMLSVGGGGGILACLVQRAVIAGLSWLLLLRHMLY